MSSGALPFIIRRLALLPLTLFIVMTITFALTQFAPGDPVRIITGVRQPDPAVAAEIREQFGLEGGFFERYAEYLEGVLARGDLGPSYFFRSPERSVQELLGDRIWVSAQINLIVLVLIYVLGIPLGVFAALNRGSWKDPGTIGFLKFFDSIPSVVFVPVFVWLLVFVIDDAFRFFGFDIPSVWTPGDEASYAVPVIALTIPSLGGMARFVRISVLQTIDEDYVRTARAKGLSERVVVYRHVLRNALLPLSTVMGLSIVGIVTGSIIVETLYGVPGVGQFIFESITQRDFNVLLGFTLLVATLFVLANLLIDVLYVYIDPRIRYTGRSG